MSENGEALTTPEPGGGAGNARTIETVLKEAEMMLESLKAFCEAGQTASDALAEMQKSVAPAVADMQSKMAEAVAASAQVVAVKTKITDDQAVIATKSDHIQHAQEHADKVRADLDRALTAATQQVTNAEAQQAKAQSAADFAANLLASIRTNKTAFEAEGAAIAIARQAAEAAASTTTALADKSSTVDARITGYEKRLADFETQCAEQLKKIESLLRGATSAGLAHAFDERRQTFLKPHNRWQSVFVISVALIVILAATGLWQVYHVEKFPSYDELARMWLARIPIAAALVWLALHASRESALAKRLEEDYGYKSAIASCFEGFRTQMSAIGVEVTHESPLAKLCGDTLKTIATPPGRIYDRHKLTVSPADEFAEASKAAVEVVKTVKPGS